LLRPQLALAAGGDCTAGRESAKDLFVFGARKNQQFLEGVPIDSAIALLQLEIQQKCFDFRNEVGQLCFLSVYQYLREVQEILHRLRDLRVVEHLLLR
jgi:hypothetical protein